MLATAAGPVARSFEPRLRFASRWYALWPAIVVAGAWFLAWDVLFVGQGIWGFSPRYVLGPKVLGLPLEEILFFVAVPYACVFLYETARHHFPKDRLRTAAAPIAWAASVFLVVLGAGSWPRAYPCVACFSTAVALAYHAYRRTPYLGQFWVGYLISLIPLVVVDGVLTGSCTAEPVVWYAPRQILGLRLGTIPVEDMIYFLLLLLSVITLYENRLEVSRSKSPEWAQA